MADNTTELEVLNEILDVLGGQSGQYETVVPTLQQILALLGGGGGGGSYNPSLSVGRADALTGADSTAQWATRVTAGSGAATVRSVQGAAVAWNQYISVAAMQGNVSTLQKSGNTCTVTALDSATQYFGVRLFGPDVVTAGHKYLVLIDVDTSTLTSFKFVQFGQAGYTGTALAGNSNITESGRLALIYEAQQIAVMTGYVNAVANTGETLAGQTFVISNPMFFDLTLMFGAGNEPATVEEFEAMYPASYYPYSAPTLKPVQIAGIASTDAQGAELDAIEWTAQTLRAAGSVADMLYSDHVDVKVGERAYQSGDESDATVRTDGTTTYYPLTTPTTTPISPALPMTYRVEQGGMESIIVPTGEISAAPVITVAEGESAGELVMGALAAIAAPDGPVATANHAVNTYLTMQGKLYKVTSAIAVGETIKAGTNITETTVMAELIARTA